MPEKPEPRAGRTSWLKAGAWAGAATAALLTASALAAPLTGAIDRAAKPDAKAMVATTATPHPEPTTPPRPTPEVKPPAPDTGQEPKAGGHEGVTETKPVQPPAEKTPPPPTVPQGGVALLAVTGAAPGGGAAVKVQTTPGASCSITYVNPAGVTSTSPKLAPKAANAEGRAAWGWKIPESEPLGPGTVSVTCNGATASAPITIG